MKHELRCDCCQEVLKPYSSKFVVGIERIKVCESCADDYVNKVKRKYYVETYNGHDMGCISHIGTVNTVSLVYRIAETG